MSVFFFVRVSILKFIFFFFTLLFCFLYGLKATTLLRDDGQSTFDNKNVYFFFSFTQAQLKKKSVWVRALNVCRILHFFSTSKFVDVCVCVWMKKKKTCGDYFEQIHSIVFHYKKHIWLCIRTPVYYGYLFLTVSHSNHSEYACMCMCFVIIWMCGWFLSRQTS